jgi:hypothetical protein
MFLDPLGQADESTKATLDEWSRRNRIEFTQGGSEVIADDLGVAPGQRLDEMHPAPLVVRGLAHRPDGADKQSVVVRWLGGVWDGHSDAEFLLVGKSRWWVVELQERLAVDLHDPCGVNLGCESCFECP